MNNNSKTQRGHVDKANMGLKISHEHLTPNPFDNNSSLDNKLSCPKESTNSLL
jgi:predicted metal-dependent phosphotriesterase family hydrolase